MSRARENPFRTEAVLQYRYVFEDGQSLAGLCEQFELLGCRAALSGPKGHGKTTLLEDLRDHLSAAGRPCAWLRIRAANRRESWHMAGDFLDQTPRSHLLLFDGCEQLAWTSWKRFERASRGHAGLLITTHRPGRLRLLRDCQTSERLLACMVRQLAPEAFSELEGRLPELFQQHRGNLRLCLRALYDWWGDRSSRLELAAPQSR